MLNISTNNTNNKINLNKLKQEYDFKKLGKPKLDLIINNARLLTTNSIVKKIYGCCFTF